jgi:hypothetical protein
MKYQVLIAEHYDTVVEVDADSEDKAFDKVERGDWSDDNIIKKDLNFRTTVDVLLFGYVTYE